MDDQFLRDLKKQPRLEFAARLRAELRALPPHAAARVAPAADFKRWFAAAASIAIVGFAFTLPAVQAGAQAFLDLFRVRQFTGVQFDPERLQSLESSGFDPAAIFGAIEPLRRRRSRSRTERRPTPGQPRAFACARRPGSRRAIRAPVSWRRPSMQRVSR